MFNWGIIRVIWNSSNHRVERRAILRQFESAQDQHQKATTFAAAARRRRRKKRKDQWDLHRESKEERRDASVRGKLAVYLSQLLGKWKFQQECRRVQEGIADPAGIFGIDDPEI